MEDFIRTNSYASSTVMVKKTATDTSDTLKKKIGLMIVDLIIEFAFHILSCMEIFLIIINLLSLLSKCFFIWLFLKNDISLF